MCNLTFGHIETLTACLHLAHPMIQTPLLVINFLHIPLSQPRTCLQNLSVIIWYSVPSGAATWYQAQWGGWGVSSFILETNQHLFWKYASWFVIHFDANPNWRRNSTEFYSTTSGAELGPELKDNLSMGKTQQRTNHLDRINNFMEWAALNWQQIAELPFIFS